MTDQKKPKIKIKNQKKIRNLFLIAFTVLILFGILIFSYSVVYAQKVLPKISVGGVDVSGLTEEAANEQVRLKTSQIQTLKFSQKDQAWELKLEDIGIKFDEKSSVKVAYQVGKSGNLSQRLEEHIKSLFLKKSLLLTYTLDKKKFFETVSNHIGAKIEDHETETQLVVTNGQPKIIAGKKGERINSDDLTDQVTKLLEFPQAKSEIVLKLIEAEPRVSADQAKPALEEAKKIVASDLKLTSKDKEYNADINLISSWIFGKVVEINKDSEAKEKVYTLEADIDKAKLANYVAALAKEVNRDPGNARITMENNQIKILAGSSIGYFLKETETIEAISALLLNRKTTLDQTSLALVIEEKQPEISTENVNSLGIKELIGQAATDFSTSPDNRKHNITVGANALSGVIVKNGEEFSSLTQLGKINAESGYLPELVISNNKLEADYGGGLCQNATTLFRAVLDAGLPITQRQNHSRRVSYYEKAIASVGINLIFDSKYASIGSSLVGYDATVFVPQPDLKFKNNTGNAILVQEYVKNNIIFAEIYGTKDGRAPSITKAEILSIKGTPAIIYHDAPDLPAGANKQLVKGAPGAKTKFTYTIKYSDGKEESQDFVSNYRAIAPEVQVGSQVVAPPPTPVP